MILQKQLSESKSSEKAVELNFERELQTLAVMNITNKHYKWTSICCWFSVDYQFVELEQAKWSVVSLCGLQLHFGSRDHSSSLLKRWEPKLLGLSPGCDIQRSWEHELKVQNCCNWRQRRGRTDVLKVKGARLVVTFSLKARLAAIFLSIC